MIRTLWIVLAISVCLVGAYVTNAHDSDSPETQKPTLVINLTSGVEAL